MNTIYLRQTRHKKRQKIVSAIVTCSFMSGIASFLFFVNTPKLTSGRELYRRIDFVRFTSLVSKEVEPEIKEKKESKPDEAAEPEPKTVERIDLSEVLPQGLKLDLTPSQKIDLSNQAPSSDQQKQSRLNLDEMDQVSGLEALTDLSSEKSPFKFTDKRSPSSLDGDGLKTIENTGTSVRKQEIEGGGNILGGPVTKGENSGAGIEIGMKDLSEFGDQFSDFSPIYKPLIEWMRQHPADLPISVKRLMEEGNWSKTLLSSYADFVAKDQKYELFLMCKEELYEIHIVLVENKKSFYLVDRGFSKKSNYFRNGVASRDSSGLINSIRTQQKAAQKEATDTFYQIFLSWWDSVKDAVSDSAES